MLDPMNDPWNIEVRNATKKELIQKVAVQADLENELQDLGIKAASDMIESGCFGNGPYTVAIDGCGSKGAYLIVKVREESW